MRILKPEEVKRKAKEKYNDNPLGWKVLYTIDKKGYPSIGLVNRRMGEQYWIKYSSVFSQQGVGAIATLNEDFPVLNDPFFDKDFGIRFLDLTGKEIKKIFEEGKLTSSVSKKIGRTYKRRKPESDDPRKVRMIGLYPGFVLNDLGNVSTAQRQLEIKMQKEIDRLTERQTTYIS